MHFFKDLQFGARQHKTGKNKGEDDLFQIKFCFLFSFNVFQDFIDTEAFKQLFEEKEGAEDIAFVRFELFDGITDTEEVGKSFDGGQQAVEVFSVFFTKGKEGSLLGAAFFAVGLHQEVVVDAFGVGDLSDEHDLFITQKKSEGQACKL